MSAAASKQAWKEKQAERRKNAHQKRAARATCFVCGRKGHVARDCPGVADGGAGQSKHRSKGRGAKASSRRKKQRAPDAAADDDCDEGAPVFDCCCDLAALYERLGAAPDVALDDLFALPEGWEGAVVSLPRPSLFSRRFVSGSGRLFYACGVGPADAEAHDAEELDKALSREDCVALGPVGLDFSLAAPSRKVQCLTLKSQLTVAVARGMPAIVTLRPRAQQAPEVHSEAEKALLEVLCSHVPDTHPLVLMAWPGRPKAALDLLQKYESACLCFTGCATFTKAKAMRELAFDVPPDRVLFGTDAPRAPPSSVGGGRNTFSVPSHVQLIARAVAKERRISAREALELGFENARRCFGISAAAEVDEDSRVVQCSRVAAEDVATSIVEFDAECVSAAVAAAALRPYEGEVEPFKQAAGVAAVTLTAGAGGTSAADAGSGANTALLAIAEALTGPRPAWSTFGKTPVGETEGWGRV